jgi:hypothetical protein
MDCCVHTQQDADNDDNDTGTYTYSTVGTATGYGLDDRRIGVRILVGSKLSLPTSSTLALGSTPTSYPMGTGGSFPGVKAAGA